MSASRIGNNNLKNSIIKKIREQKMEVVPFIYRDGMIESEALQLERQLIARFGRRNLNEGILSNLTDGGEGGHRVVWSEDYESIKDAARDNPQIKYATIWAAIKNGRVLSGARWRYA